MFGHSNAMICDAIHSFSDVLSTFIVIIGIKLANKKADFKHPYGHERLESVAAIILSSILFFIGLKIGFTGLNLIVKHQIIPLPNLIALIGAVISIITKELMYQYTKKAALKINSDALLADAWHHRSDALSSIGSLIGIIASKLGYPIFDPIASILICGFILKVAVDIFKDAINKMIDHSCNKETLNLIEHIIYSHNEVKHIDELKTRLFGNRIYVEIEIAVDRNYSLIKSHEVAHHVHDDIENSLKDVKHCFVHVNPL